MRQNYKYHILRYNTGSIRGEVLNVGVTVWNGDTPMYTFVLPVNHEKLKGFFADKVEALIYEELTTQYVFCLAVDGPNEFNKTFGSNKLEVNEYMARTENPEMIFNNLVYSYVLPERGDSNNEGF